MTILDKSLLNKVLYECNLIRTPLELPEVSEIKKGIRSALYCPISMTISAGSKDICVSSTQETIRVFDSLTGYGLFVIPTPEAIREFIRLFDASLLPDFIVNL